MIAIKKIEEKDLAQLASLLEELSGQPINMARMRENFSWMTKNDNYIVLGAYHMKSWLV